MISKSKYSRLLRINDRKSPIRHDQKIRKNISHQYQNLNQHRQSRLSLKQTPIQQRTLRSDQEEHSAIQPASVGQYEYDLHPGHRYCENVRRHQKINRSNDCLLEINHADAKGNRHGYGSQYHYQV